MLSIYMSIKEYFIEITRTLLFVTPLLVAFLLINYFVFKNDILTSIKNTLVLLLFTLSVVIVVVIAIEITVRWYNYVDKKVRKWFGESG